MRPFRSRQQPNRIFLLVVTLAMVAGALIGVASTAQAAVNTTLAVNGSSGGRTFDGVGAISGGGGNSRLLIDYPPAQRSQILDYLFKPDYGASVQLLKLEIGGDANSTDGAEPSIEHVKGDINCNAGYEFWLGEQAVARNPNIKLMALPWAAPGWIGGGNFWSTDMVNYDIAWLNCAKGHGLNINYIGGWNERGHDKGWYESLRAALNSNGYGSVQIEGDDSGWSTADDMIADPAFNNAVQVVGDHYPCGYESQAVSCSTTANADATGKPLWASEFGSQDDNTGVAPFIRTITRGYLDAQLTGFMNWPLIAAITPNLPYATVGLMDAGSPWSGSYNLGKNLWANAQVAQFTQPGWKFIDGSASGYLGGDRANGSYVSLKSTNNSDYSTIYETSGATAAQTVTVNVTNGLNTGTVHIWSTDMGSSNQADYFVRQPDVTPSNGSYTLTLQPNHIYSVTTTTGQAKGTATSPASSSLALPYSDNFDSYASRSEAKYFSDMQGSYEVRPCASGHSGQCLQQVAPIKPIEWQDDSDAYTLAGDPSWSNYTVSTDVNLEQAGTVTLLGRANTQNRPQSHQAAYQLRVNDAGAWSIVKVNSGGGVTTLSSGSHAALGLNNWHTIKLGFSGNTITATLDGATLATVTDTAYTTGQIGLGVQGYQTDQFDNLTVTPNPAGNLAGVLKGQQSGRCLDVPNASQTNGATPVLWDCNGGGNQAWTATPSKQLMVYGTKCLDALGQGTANGTAVDIWDCNGGANQQWTLNPDGTIVGVQSGKCLEVANQATANNAAVDLRTCNGGANQKWFRGSTVGQLKGAESARCVDLPAGNQTNGTRPALWDCNGGGNQDWTSTSSGQLTVYDTKCLDVVGGTADGSAVDIWDCTGAGNQQWTVNADGTVVNVGSGKCLDATGHGTANNTLLEIWTCNGGANQKWARAA